MITGAIILGIVIFALMILWVYINDNGGDFGIVMAVLIIIEAGLVGSIGWILILNLILKI